MGRDFEVVGGADYRQSITTPGDIWTTWDNPKPDKKVKTLDYSTTKETICAPFCVAMTVEEK